MNVLEVVVPTAGVSQRLEKLDMISQALARGFDLHTVLVREDNATIHILVRANPE